MLYFIVQLRLRSLNNTYMSTTKLFQKLLSFSLLFFGLALSSQAQVFVKADATGQNDGSSWANAYTDLQSALSSASTDDIWIAAGTYLPGGAAPDQDSQFFINSPKTLYGGFAGTEAMLSERDVMANPTILSGDLQGDDISGNLNDNRTDNVIRIVEVDSLIQDDVVFDGLSFRGGNTLVDNTLALNRIAGGAILTWSTIQVNNCTFEDNFAYTGGAIYAFGDGTSGSSFTNCNFTNNGNVFRGAGINLAGVTDATITDCQFVDNSTNRGAVFLEFCLNTFLDDCLFQNNVDTAGTGGAFYNFASPLTTLFSCDFIDNDAPSGGAMFTTGAPIGLPLNMLVDSCTFIGNTAVDFSSVLRTLNTVGTVFRNCLFEENVSPTSGILSLNDTIPLTPNVAFLGCDFNNNESSGGFAGIFYGLTCNVFFADCDFTNNSTLGRGGVAFMETECVHQFNNCTFTNNTADLGGAVFDQGTVLGFYDNCTFNRNTTGSDGGAIFVGFASEINVSNSAFTSNAGRRGGAIFSQNDNTTINVDSTSFESNVTNDDTGSGGAISTVSSIVDVKFCTFNSNVARAFGGAISMVEDSLDLATLNIENSRFNFNQSLDGQGGAINVGNVETTITNAVFATNVAEEGSGTPPGRGGAISVNASANLLNGIYESDTSRLTIINSTFVDNIGLTAGAITMFEDEDTADAILILQNTILYADPSAINDPLYAVENGMPLVISNGGNLCTDATLNSFLTNTNDLTETDPLLENPIDELYGLTANSPARDKGIRDGAPDADIDGTERCNLPDMGAFEFVPADPTECTVSTRNLVDNAALELSPNPATTHLNLALENTWTGNVQLRLLNALGQPVKTIQLQKWQDRLEQNIAVDDLQAGAYLIELSTDQELLVKFLIIQ